MKENSIEELKQRLEKLYRTQQARLDAGADDLDTREEIAEVEEEIKELQDDMNEQNNSDNYTNVGSIENSIEEDIKENRSSKSNIVPVLINNKMYFIDNELYKELLKEIKKDNKLRDKTIDLMAEYIESKKTLVDKYYNVLTAGTIKKYFENKAKESEE